MASIKWTTRSDAAALTSYNRGPLTTIFTPPATCLNVITYSSDLGTQSAVTGSAISNLILGHYRSVGDAACYPPSVGTSTTEWGVYFYSPGMCPKGWTAECTQYTFTTITDFRTRPETGTGVVIPIGSDTSRALCCPS